MNNIEFENGLLLSPTLMSDVQDDWKECIDGLAKMYGNCILYGCQSNGETISDGAIVVNGELIRFEGGTAYANFSIVTETRYGTFKSGAAEIGYSKYAQCAVDGTYSLAAFPRVKVTLERRGSGSYWSIVSPLTGKASNVTGARRSVLGFKSTDTTSLFSVFEGKLLLSCCFDVTVAVTAANEPFAYIDAPELNLTRDVVFSAKCWKQVTENDHFVTDEFFVLDTTGHIRKLYLDNTILTAPYTMYTTATVIDLD